MDAFAPNAADVWALLSSSAARLCRAGDKVLLSSSAARLCRAGDKVWCQNVGAGPKSGCDKGRSEAPIRPPPHGAGACGDHRRSPGLEKLRAACTGKCVRAARATGGGLPPAVAGGRRDPGSIQRQSIRRRAAHTGSGGASVQVAERHATPHLAVGRSERARAAGMVRRCVHACERHWMGGTRLRVRT